MKVPVRAINGALLRLVAATLFLCLGATPLLAVGDYDGDGYDDLWKFFHGVTLAEFPLHGDYDGDGVSNADESAAGTDPRDPADHLAVVESTISETEFSLTFTTVAGKRYRAAVSNSPGGPAWTPVGAPAIGTGSLHTLAAAKGGGDRQFYRILVDDLDSDGDGASDWAELRTGTNPNEPNSGSNASGGIASDGETLRSLLTVEMGAVAPDAYENPPAEGRVRLSRSHGTMPLSLPIAILGPLDPKRGAASSSDYSLAGTPGETVTFPADAATHDLVVTPVADSLVEVPETLRFLVARPGLGGAGELSAEVKIRDRPAIEENRRLFVAYLTPIDGVMSSASGVVTALVEGDNDRALVSVSFSNLSSEQNTTYVRFGENQEVAFIPRGQVNGHTWNLRAANTLQTDQATLDALEAGQLFISISSANFPEGEIRGTLQQAEGSIGDPPPPPAPPAYGSVEFPNLAAGGTDDNAELDRDIARFLMQASFGPTEESIAEVRALVAANGNNALAGYEAWIDDQINNVPNPSFQRLVEAADIEEFVLRGNKPVNFSNDPQFGTNSTQFNTGTRLWDASSIHQNNYPFRNNRRREWWTLVLNAQAQLRQRMAFALSEIAVISDLDTTIDTFVYGTANYWDLLATNAFGRYRTVLEGVTYSPQMGVYLSHLKNQKQSGSIAPDENFAREIMQLFTIGLVQRHLDGSLKLDPVTVLPIPTYDQGDITEMARVMTGMSFGKYHANVSGAPTYPSTSTQAIGAVLDNATFTRGNGHRYWQASWTNPMRMFSAQHDFNGYTAYTGLPLPAGVPSASKILFRGKPGQKVIPVRSQSDANGNADVTDALNALAGSPGGGAWDGHPTTPVFVSRLLIQRFTSSNPSNGYLYRVASVFQATKGDLGEVVKAILLDYEARTLPLGDEAGRGKVKEPLLHFTSLLRGLGYESRAPLSHLATMTVPFTATQSPVTTPYPATELAKFREGATRFRFFDTDASLAQTPQRAPSVFNWFLPDYVFPGTLGAAGLVAPELQVATESNVVNTVNAHYTMLYSRTEPSAISAQELFTGFRYGRGADNFFNLSQYKTAGGVQLSVPAYALPHDPATNPGGRGYFLKEKFDEHAVFPTNPSVRENPESINDQLDNLLLGLAPMEARYTAAYLASLAAQYGSPGNVPAAPGSTQRTLAHDAAAEAMLDHFDVLLSAGYLKAKFGGSGGLNPRQAILDGLASGYMGNRTYHTDHALYRAAVVQRVKNIAYLAATSPQALVLK